MDRGTDGYTYKQMIGVEVERWTEEQRDLGTYLQVNRQTNR
jgi:hypothetical protein